MTQMRTDAGTPRQPPQPDGPQALRQIFDFACANELLVFICDARPEPALTNWKSARN
jgi:hypothetical protein